jgi:hypothetical protein
MFSAAAVFVKESFPNFEGYLRMKEKYIFYIADDYAILQTHRVALSLDFTSPMILMGLKYWLQDMKRMGKIKILPQLAVRYEFLPVGIAISWYLQHIRLLCLLWKDTHNSFNSFGSQDMTQCQGK